MGGVGVLSYHNIHLVFILEILSKEFSDFFKNQQKKTKSRITLSAYFLVGKKLLSAICLSVRISNYCGTINGE
jgi:hypothetical protein